MFKNKTTLTLAVLLALGTGACSASAVTGSAGGSQETAALVSSAETDEVSDTEETNTEVTAETENTEQTENTETADGMFTERDLEQTADTADAERITLEDGQTVTIDTEGVYVVSGTAKNVQIIVDALDSDKVQIVLDGLNVTNESIPVIYVKNADKVFVTTADSVNELTVSGEFTDDGDVHTDAVIFSKDDLVLNGTGTLKITSAANGITSKDDLKVTGGNIDITCKEDALEANDSIRIADGTVTVSTEKDGLHAENDEDDSAGFIYISGGSLKIEAGDDAIHGTTTVTVDGGTLDLSGRECIEATVITVNDGSITIAASDDGINAGKKSSQYSPLITVSGGDIKITMGQGDTDAVDSNGDLVISGGTLDITAQSPFDYDGTASLSGGKVIVNGTEMTQITNQFGGQGQMPGGQAGDMPAGGEGFPGGRHGHR